MSSYEQNSAGALLLVHCCWCIHVCCFQAIFKSIVTAAAGRHDVFERLCNGILLVGPGAALRGLGPMLERRLMQRFSSAGRQQVRSLVFKEIYLQRLLLEERLFALL